MKPFDIFLVPFYMIGVDLIGPLKLTRQGNKYILSIIDYYTKYAEAVALPNQEAETVVRALEQVFARHGMPSVLLTDQGRNFESHLVASICQLFGIEKRRTTAYHPQTDGLGVEPEELETKPTHEPAKYLEDINKRQNNMRKMVMERIEQSQKKQKRCYDSRNRACRRKDLTIGDTVLLKNFRARGLDKKYVGPYLVVDVQDTSCEIESLANKTRNIVHGNNLKRFSIDYDIDHVQRNDDGANVMHGYNLRRNRRVPDRYGIYLLWITEQIVKHFIVIECYTFKTVYYELYQLNC